MATRLLVEASAAGGNCGVSYLGGHVVCTEEGPGESINRVWFDEQVVRLVGWEDGNATKNIIRSNQVGKLPPSADTWPYAIIN